MPRFDPVAGLRSALRTLPVYQALDDFVTACQEELAGLCDLL